VIETRKDKIKDYVIAILLAVIAILIGIIYSKLLMDKNNTDIDSAAQQTRKALQDYFKAIDTDGYVLNDFSSNANFDYTLGTVKLFNKDYKISLKNNYSECEPDCKYMYKLYINETESYNTSFLSGIKVGVIGNYVAVEENHGNSNFTLLLIRPNDKVIVQQYNYNGPLSIKYEDNIYTIFIKEENCEENIYNGTTITYNKTNNTFEETKVPSYGLLQEINQCK
jgi:hypothetical protein